MERVKWKKWWAIPLALGLAEVAGHWFFLFIVDFLRGPQFEPMPPEEAEQFAALVENCRLAFSVLLLVIIGLILRRFCDRAQLLRSAAVMAAYQAAVAAITRIVPFSPVLMYLGLPWGPLTDITSTLTLWLGRGSRLTGPFAMALSISAPLSLSPLEKRNRDQKVVISLQVETSCKVIGKTDLNPHAIRLDLEVGTMVRDSFKNPGQFVHVKCGHSRLLRRPISVCSCMEDQPSDLLSLVFEVRGSGTDWLARREVGDELDILGLIGNGFDMKPEGRYLLIGGGIGVPPMLGCAQYARGRCDAVLGARDTDHTLLVDDFREICPNVAVATEDGSLGEKGFVTGPMEALLKENKYDAVLCCGPKPMLKAAADLAARYNVPCQVSLEERMACGVGACLGCAVGMTDGSMKHVCKDGPIFNALEVDWNG